MRAQAAAGDLTAAPRALRRSARNSQAPEAAPGGARALDALDDVALDVAIDLSAAAVAASPAPLSPEPDVAIARSAETQSAPAALGRGGALLVAAQPAAVGASSLEAGATARSPHAAFGAGAPPLGAVAPWGATRTLLQ